MIGPSRGNMELTLYSRLGPVTWDPSWIFRVIQIMFSYPLIKAPDLFGHFMTLNFSHTILDSKKKEATLLWILEATGIREVFQYGKMMRFFISGICSNCSKDSRNLNQHRSRNAVLPVSVSGTQPTQLNPILRPLPIYFFSGKRCLRSNGSKEFYHLVNCWRFWVVAIFDEWYILFT